MLFINKNVIVKSIGFGGWVDLKVVYGLLTAMKIFENFTWKRRFLVLLKIADIDCRSPSVTFCHFKWFTYQRVRTNKQSKKSDKL